MPRRGPLARQVIGELHWEGRGATSVRGSVREPGTARSALDFGCLLSPRSATEQALANAAARAGRSRSVMTGSGRVHRLLSVQLAVERVDAARRLQVGLGVTLDVQLRQVPAEPVRHPPVAVPEEVHH